MKTAETDAAAAKVSGLALKAVAALAQRSPLRWPSSCSTEAEEAPQTCLVAGAGQEQPPAPRGEEPELASNS